MASPTLTARILARIAAEVRPRLTRHPGDDDGYNCCGCAAYARIVEDIEAIVRAEGAAGELAAATPIAPPYPPPALAAAPASSTPKPTG